MKNCCSHTNRSKKCRRKDGKVFKLPRKYSRHTCLTKKNKGFSMKSSCAPYKNCKKSKFLYNPDNPKKSFDVYVNKNPDDTISIKYSTINDVKQTISKLERLYKRGKYPHKRIWQVGMIMYVRLKAMKKHKKTKYPNAKKVNERLQLSKKYYQFLSDRTKAKTEKDRKKLTFRFN